MSVSIGVIRGILTPELTIVDSLSGRHVPCEFLMSVPGWFFDRLVDVTGEIIRDEKGLPVEVKNATGISPSYIVKTRLVGGGVELRGTIKLAPDETAEAAIRRLREGR